MNGVCFAWLLVVGAMLYVFGVSTGMQWERLNAGNGPPPAGHVRSFFRLFGTFIASVVTLLFSALMSGCASSSPIDAEPRITRACYRSFAPTVDAWDQVVGRAPLECAYLDKEYTVQLLHQSGDFLACTPVASSWTVAGCTHPPTSTIYMLASDDNVQMTNTSVHEWVHALADCVDGDADPDHLRAELWADYGANTVELQAQASAEIGACL